MSDPVVAESHTGLEAFRIYGITDRASLAQDRFLETLEAALKAGLRSLQLREKDLDPADLLELAKQVQALTAQYGAQLMINHHADIADAVGAQGVHLTESSAPTEDIRKKYPHLVIGVSTHSLEGAQRAEAQGADFVTFSPIFDTPSKRQYGEPQGLKRLREVTEAVNLPVIALGGINRDNIRSVLDHGAFGVAMISGIWNSSDIKATLFEYMQHFPGDPS